MISNSGHDERGRYSGGKAGDQTGDEWTVRSWYDRPWNVILRHPDKKVRDMIAEMAKAAANNNKIGYDQSQRGTFWTQLKKAKYHPEDIKTACEADCSAGVAAIVKGVGYRLSIDKLKSVPTTAYTGNLREYLCKAGFVAMIDKMYTKSQDYLLAGDILLNESYHTAINLTDGKKANASTSGVDKTVKTINAIALEVIDGKWGNGDYRRRKLREHGFDPDKVQAEVNRILKGK